MALKGQQVQVTQAVFKSSLSDHMSNLRTSVNHCFLSKYIPVNWY